MSIQITKYIKMFWENLEKLCKNRNITPNKLAKELNYSNAIATAWKKGSPPNSEKLIAIADYFEVSTDYLLGRSITDTELQEDELRLLHNYRGATAEAKEIIQATAETAYKKNQNLEETA